MRIYKSLKSVTYVAQAPFGEYSSSVEIADDQAAKTFPVFVTVGIGDKIVSLRTKDFFVRTLLKELGATGFILVTENGVTHTITKKINGMWFNLDSTYETHSLDNAIDNLYRTQEAMQIHI